MSPKQSEPGRIWTTEDKLLPGVKAGKSTPTSPQHHVFVVAEVQGWGRLSPRPLCSIGCEQALERWSSHPPSSPPSHIRSHVVSWTPVNRLLLHRGLDLEHDPVYALSTFKSKMSLGVHHSCGCMYMYAYVCGDHRETLGVVPPDPTLILRSGLSLGPGTFHS